MRFPMAFEVHRHKGRQLHEARIDAPPPALITPWHLGDEIGLEPLDRLTRRQLIDFRGVDARVDWPGHQRHAFRHRLFAIARHDCHGGQSLNARLADGNDVSSRSDGAQPLDDMSDISVESEDTRVEARIARILPIGDVEIVVSQKRFGGISKQRREMARKRRDQEHAGLLRRNVFFEMEERSEGRSGQSFLSHGNIAIAHADALDTIGGPGVGELGSRDEFQGRRNVVQKFRLGFFR